MDGVRECCLVALKGNGDGGDVRPTLVLSLKPFVGADGSGRIYEEVKARLSQNGLEDLITRILIVREPLMNENEFKLNRRRIAELINRGELTAYEGTQARSSAAGAGSELLSRVMQLFADALGKELSEISPESDFFLDLGGSSLDFFGVVSKIRHDYDIAFPVDSGRSLSTPSEIAAFMTETLNGGRQ